ncbi:thioredoxin-like protein [Sphaerosporella brunnea]|uniref:Thioredoxin-like protein n=1 Tax=Sphaerosporella brunnea TaxID=1250544 RepID=A0A5J5EHN1_9PEZI|nr:thioredoxin-like protein [Sphaerosporella brunnea]
MSSPSSASSSGSSDLSLSHLTEAQRQSLRQFTDITAQPISQALPLLERSQWNAELAISRFFDGETAESLAEALQAEEYARVPVTSAAGHPTSPVSRRATSGLTPAPRIVPQRDVTARRSPLLISILLFPFSLVWRIAHGAAQLLYLLFPFLPRFRSLQRGPAASTTAKRSINPRDTAARFARSFEEEYGPSTGLTFFEGGYAQALDLAKKDLRFLLVVMQSDEHDETASFNRHTLTSQEVTTFLKTHNLILWGGSVQESEAFQVATALNCTKFPFAALITHAPNAPEGTSSQGMSVVARIVGTVTPAQFTAKLQTAINTHTPALDRIRATRAAQEADRAIRDQSQRAYDASLQRDRARKEAEEAARRAAALVAETAAKREQWRRWRASTIPAEPPADGAVARLSIRTIAGDRVVRRFARETPMEVVYAFVDSLGIDADDVGGEKPQAYQHQYGFRLVSVMPREEFLPDATTVGEVLWPSGNLIVESLDDHEEEEGEEEEQ